MLLLHRKGGNPLFGGRPAVKEPKNNAANLIFFYIIFTIIFILRFLQILLRMEPIYIVISLVFDLLALILHIVLSTKNPGYISNEGI